MTTVRMVLAELDDFGVVQFISKASPEQELIWFVLPRPGWDQLGQPKALDVTLTPVQED